jgi:hypothetical protein
MKSSKQKVNVPKILLDQKSIFILTISSRYNEKSNKKNEGILRFLIILKK